jgi:hypothetical protein
LRVPVHQIVAVMWALLVAKMLALVPAVLLH